MADEIKNLDQSLDDLASAIDAKQQEFADSLAIKNTQISDKDTQIADQATQIATQGTQIATQGTQITDLQAQIVTKDARIAELEAAAGTSIDPAAVIAATTKVQALTTDIASTPT